jgi:beta-galactosidase GanA
MYRLMRNADYAVDYIGVTQPEKFKNYKVLYFPYYTMLDNKIVPYLQEFLENGGIVIADEGFGMRAPNTWIQVGDIDCKPIMQAKLLERRMCDGEAVDFNGETVHMRPYKSEYQVENAEVLVRFADGAPAVQKVRVGKGKLYLCGFSIGYSYAMEKSGALLTFMDGILQEAGAKKYEYAAYTEGVYEKRLQKEEEEIVFLFNNGEKDKTFSMQGEILSFGGDGSLDGNTLCVTASGMAYVVIKK